MKKVLLTTFLMFAFLALVGISYCQDLVTGMGSGDYVPRTGEQSVHDYMGGEHTPLIFTGSFTLQNGVITRDTTQWMQLGFSKNGNMDIRGSNYYAQRLNPQNFTFCMNLDSADGGADDDSVGTGGFYFETAYDTLNGPFYDNPDSSNYFLRGGTMSASTSAWDEIYVFDVPATGVSTRGWKYPLRVFDGDWIRFIGLAAIDTPDSIINEWRLKCEH